MTREVQVTLKRHDPPCNSKDCSFCGNCIDVQEEVYYTVNTVFMCGDCKDNVEEFLGAADIKYTIE